MGPDPAASFETQLAPLLRMREKDAFGGRVKARPFPFGQAAGFLSLLSMLGGGFCNIRAFWDRKRTFGPFHRRVIAAYALEFGAA